MRRAVKKTLREKSDIYEDVDIGSQSYQNVRDTPFLNTSNRSSQTFNDEVTSSKQIRPKMIPPRMSQDPIPTPRKSSLSRSRNQSVESLHGMNSLPRKLINREPHYKVPPPNPRPVNPNDCHQYSQILYEDDQDNQKFKEMIINKKSSETGKSNRQQPDQIRHTNQKEKSSRKSLGNTEESTRKSVNSKYQNNYLEERRLSVGGSRSRSKQKPNICKNDDDLDNNSNNFANSDVKVELTGEEDRFYDVKEELVKKSKAIATLPNGSKYPCVIVQKKSKSTDNSLRRENSLQKEFVTPPQTAQRNFKNYIPVEMKMKPDWFDDLKVKEDPKDPQPSSIIDGVLYTSRALIEEEKAEAKPQKLNTFNLIQSEVFETYDVCKNVTREFDKMSKVTTVETL